MNAPATQAQKERMASYWRLIGTCFGQDELSQNFQDQVTEIVRREELPPALLDAQMGIEVLKKRNPALRPHKHAAGAAGAAAASPGSAPARQLLRLHPASANGIAALLGTGEGWSGISPDLAESVLSDESGTATGIHPAAALLAAWPAASSALAKLAGSRQRSAGTA